MRMRDKIDKLSKENKKLEAEVRILMARVAALEKENTLLSLYGRRQA